MNGNPAGAPISVVPQKPEHPAETASQPDNEFEQFEDLASKLTQVPKSELDEKRQHA